MTKFIMHGCNGAMGQVITRLAKEDPDVEIGRELIFRIIGKTDTRFLQK